MSSFTDLANAAAETEEDKREIKFLKEIQEPDEREKQLFIIVKRLLKNARTWFLIYDNVESIKDIRDYFPTNKKMWGIGKVLITTRNENIKHNSLLDRKTVFNVQALTPQEKLFLFQNIMHENLSSISPQQREKNNIFLKNIPSFPLDVLTAAYYIKNTKISFAEYLNRTNALNRTFERAKADLLNETTSYTKTRYGVVTLSLKRLIMEYPDFENFLLFMGIADSQNIPFPLLSTFKTSTFAETFVRHFHKYSFITNECTMGGNILTFSIHRSVQAIILAYLKDHMTERTKISKVTKVTQVFEKYLAQQNIREDLEMLRLLMPHGEALVTHRDVPDFEKHSIRIALGFAYFHLGDYYKSLTHLNKSKNYFETSYGKNHIKTLQALSHLGGTEHFLGRRKQAQKHLRQSLEKIKKHHPENIPLFLWTLVELGHNHLTLGEYNVSNKLLTEGLHIHERYYGKEHKETGWSSMHLGIAHQRLGKYESANKLYHRSLKIFKKVYGDNHIRVGWAIARLGDTQKHLGHYEKARNYLRKGLEFFEKENGKMHVNNSWIMISLGDVYRHLKLYSQARELLDKAFNVNTKHYGSNSVETAWVLFRLGQLNITEGKEKTGNMLLQKSLNVLREKKHPKSIFVHESLAVFYLDQTARYKKKNDEEKQIAFQQQALINLQQALKIATEVFPADSPHIQRLKIKIEKLMCQETA